MRILLLCLNDHSVSFQGSICLTTRILLSDDKDPFVLLQGSFHMTARLLLSNCEDPSRPKLCWIWLTAVYIHIKLEISPALSIFALDHADIIAAPDFPHETAGSFGFIVMKSSLVLVDESRAPARSLENALLELAANIAQQISYSIAHRNRRYLHELLLCYNCEDATEHWGRVNEKGAFGAVCSFFFQQVLTQTLIILSVKARERSWECAISFRVSNCWIWR